MADLMFAIDVSDCGPHGPRAFGAIAAALSRHDVDHVLTHAHRAGGSWLRQHRTGPIGVLGVARYSTALENTVEALVREAAPDAAVTVDWDAVTHEQAEAAALATAVYRLAELFAALDDGRFLARVGQALVSPKRNGQRFDFPADPKQEFYDAMGEAHLIVGVDWKSTHVETADAIGMLRVLPTGVRTVASTVRDFAGLRAAWAVDDQDGDGPRPYTVVADALAAALLPDVLLHLSNGDTPGFVAAAPALVAEVLARAKAARIPLDHYG